VGGAAETEDVHEHGLVVAAPVEADEIELGAPAHRDVESIHRGPRPVHAPIQLVRERADGLLLGIVEVEEIADEQHAGDEQRGVDGGDLGIAVAMTRREIQEVIEETFVTGGARGVRPLWRVAQELERHQDACDRGVARHESALHADRVGIEREAAGRDAGEGRLRPAIGDEPGACLGRIPEEIEGALGDVVEQRIELANRSRRQRARSGRAIAGRGSTRGKRQPCATACERAAPRDARARTHAAGGPGTVFPACAGPSPMRMQDGRASLTRRIVSPIRGVI
jgi:hypothetical protein